VNDGERGDDLPRAKRTDTHTRARAPFRIVKPTPPPPFPPILLHQSILFLIPLSAVFFSCNVCAKLAWNPPTTTNPIHE
jgi:hypothetical protein